jgi:Mo-co oxidoreductase dimerisation domain
MRCFGKRADLVVQEGAPFNAETPRAALAEGPLTATDVLDVRGHGPVEVRGYAFAGGERSVERVDVSLDGGVRWSYAELLEDLGRWAWRHWRIIVDLVRAWDSSAATQPVDESALWNPKGYVNNARPRIRVRAA